MESRDIYIKLAAHNVGIRTNLLNNLHARVEYSDPIRSLFEATLAEYETARDQAK